MNVAEALRLATSYLEEHEVASPRVDAELLLGRAAGLSRLELYTQHDRPLTDSELAGARELLRRRGRREPLAYVLGDWDFRRLRLKTDARALVPRPETEIVVERCLMLLAGVDRPRICDVGTGTGAIALSLAHEHPGSLVTAVDSSEPALTLAGENAAENGLDVSFVRSDLLAAVDGPFDLVVSNPPYVSAEELAGLDPEVRDYEPRAALVDRGQTERLAEEAARVLGGVGYLVLEVHEERAAHVAAHLGKLGYEDVTVAADLGGRDRVVEGRWTRS